MVVNRIFGSHGHRIPPEETWIVAARILDCSLGSGVCMKLAVVTSCTIFYSCLNFQHFPESHVHAVEARGAMPPASFTATLSSPVWITILDTSSMPRSSTLYPLALC
jgi:hypothetical protein